MEAQAISGGNAEREATQAVVELAVSYGERAVADIAPTYHYVVGAGATLTGSALGILVGIPSNNESLLGLGGGIVGALAGFAILSAAIRRT